MTTTRTFRYLTIATAAALSLTLASCSTAGDEDPTTADGEGTAAEQTEQTDAETDAPAEETDEPAAAAGPECLVGTWEMTSEAMQEQVLAQLGGEGEVSVEGTSSMEFTGDQLTTTSDVTSSYAIEIEGTTMEGSTVTDGSIVIGYTADDSTITYGEVVSAEGAVTIEASGTEQEISFEETASTMADQAVSYTCSDTELTIVTEAAGISTEQTLTRAG